jgi:hypothetical protein
MRAVPATTTPTMMGVLDTAEAKELEGVVLPATMKIADINNTFVKYLLIAYCIEMLKTIPVG